MCALWSVAGRVKIRGKKAGKAEERKNLSNYIRVDESRYRDMAPH